MTEGIMVVDLKVNTALALLMYRIFREQFIDINFYYYYCCCYCHHHHHHSVVKGRGSLNELVWVCSG
jgi:myosin-crossreactive antigen